MGTARRITFLFLPFILLALPLVIGYILNVALKFSSTDFVLGMYFFVLIIYITIQYIVALLHRHRINTMDRGDYSRKVSILVVGYKENKEYFDACVSSIKCLSYPSIENIVFVNDGDDHSSAYMNDIFNSVFNGSGSHRTRCISIPHAGKRHAMYRGFQEIECDNSEYIFTLDSDTILKPDCIERLVDRIQTGHTGGVTGNVKIFNTHSVVSLLSSLRYWFAFNIERAAQSYFGVVSCVSGPLGLYRKDLILDAKNDWINQTFFGKECSYGDDRHLTFQVLKRGYSVGYTHLAEAYTETPTGVTRWFKQQTRWNKSSIREIKWIINTLDHHSFWLALELVYISVYHFIVLGSLLYIIWDKDFFYITTWFSVIFVLSLFKSIVPAIIERDLSFLLYPVYNIVFILGFIPSKFYAMLTISDTSWGTSNRLALLSSVDWSTIGPLSTWSLFLLSGILYNGIFTSHWSLGLVVYTVTIACVYSVWCLLALVVSRCGNVSLAFVLNFYDLQLNKSLVV